MMISRPKDLFKFNAVHVVEWLVEGITEKEFNEYVNRCKTGVIHN